MKSTIWAFFFILTLGLAQNVGEAQKLGDLVINLTGVSISNVLIDGLGKFDPAPGRYWVVADLNFQNSGSSAVCARFTGTLSAEYGLTAHTGLGRGYQCF